MVLAVTQQAGWDTRKHRPPEVVGRTRRGWGRGASTSFCLSEEPPGQPQKQGRVWPGLLCPLPQFRRGRALGNSTSLKVSSGQRLNQGIGFWAAQPQPFCTDSVHLAVHLESAQSPRTPEGTGADGERRLTRWPSSDWNGGGGVCN